MSIPSLYLLAAGQIVLILLLVNIFTLLYNRHLRRRNRSLIEKAGKAGQPLQQTKTPSPPSSQKTTTSNHQDSGIFEVAGGDMSQLLNRALEQTQARLHELGTEITEINMESSAEQIAAAMRYQFLESEKQALAFMNDPKLLWETLQPNLDKISHALHASPAEKEKVQRKITTLSQEIVTLKNQSQESAERLEKIQDTWKDKSPLFENHYQYLVKSTQKAENRPQLHECLDSFYNTLLDVGGIIHNEKPDYADAALLMETVYNTPDSTHKKGTKTLDQPLSENTTQPPRSSEEFFDDTYEFDGDQANEDKQNKLENDLEALVESIENSEETEHFRLEDSELNDIDPKDLLESIFNNQKK